MPPRRSLEVGLKTEDEVDRKLADQFIYGDKTKDRAVASAPASSQKAEGKGSAIPRVPFTTRVRADYAEALKRASLERQLQKVQPNTLQEILEEALAPWLGSNGYLVESAD
jgi:hypothetical protein